jgi:phosphatidate cytidylyltransferase
MWLTLAALFIWTALLRSKELWPILPVASATVFGVLYIFGAWRCGVGLRALDPWWLMFALAINWVGDSFAYYGGRAFGRHKLSPSISPGKTWEGTLASLAGTAALGVWFLHWRFPKVELPQALLLCLVANVAGQIGDLCESAIKRGAGVKDSGNLLPGHGGWLDRVDSSLFSVPVVYWLLEWPWIRP